MNEEQLKRLRELEAAIAQMIAEDAADKEPQIPEDAVAVWVWSAEIERRLVFWADVEQDLWNAESWRPSHRAAELRAAFGEVHPLFEREA